MALFRDLIRTIADAEGISEMTVTGIGQYLRDEGLISKHGRGRAAAQMSVEDATSLLIGVNACSLAKDAPRIVRSFAELTRVDEIYPAIDDGDALSRVLVEPESAVGFISNLLRLYIDEGGGIEQVQGLQIRLTFSRPLLALNAWIGWISDSDEEADEAVCVLKFSPETADEPAGDRLDETTITEVTLSAIGSALSN